MSIFDRFRSANPTFDLGGDMVVGSWFGSEVTVKDLYKMTPTEMWATQPHLRTVVGFLARNSAQCGLHVYRNLPDDSRERDRSSLAARLLRHPNDEMTGYDLVFSLVGDLALYDVAYWNVAPTNEPTANGTGWEIVRMPPEWVTPKKANAFQQAGFTVKAPGAKDVWIPKDEMFVVHGYNPSDPKSGSSAVQTLKETLQEQLQANAHRLQIWKNGGRVSTVLRRPKDAPRWSDRAREQFREDWYSNYTGNGPRAGGTPILDDGMELQKVGFSATEQQYVEGTKLSLVTVCGVYFVNPTMVGLLDNANYSVVREYRRALYGDTLGPTFAQIEAAVNVFLLPMLGMDPEESYVEFNIKEKLQGSFEEEAAVLTSATGAPYMLRSEARARQNLPAVDGMDEPVVPLNVLVGGQASPSDSGSQNVVPGTPPEESRGAPRRKSVHRWFKASVSDGWRTQGEKMLRKHFERQERVVRTALGRKDGSEWWDEQRWDDELATDLLRLSYTVAGEIGPQAAAALGYKPDDYDEGRTIAFLRAVSERVAHSINAATKQALDEALQSPEDDAFDSVWTVAQEQRSGSAGAQVVASAAGFATVEAATQLEPKRAVKTWETGSNPRPSHASMNGETVGIEDTFSNGAAWPGDSSLDADESAGCNCTISVGIE